MDNQNETSYHSLSDKILERIEKENIEPSSKLRLRLMNDGFWILWILSIFVGAAAVAGTLFVLLNNDWKSYSVVYDSFFYFIFDTLPYLWILTLLVFLLLAHQNVRHTKYGYRYPVFAIIILSAIASLVIGICLYIFGLGEIIEDNIGGYIPLYQPLIQNQQLKWNDPKNGILAGTITYIAPDFSSFELSAYDGKKWQINGNDLLHIDHLILSKYTEVKVVGIPLEEVGSGVLFHACLILPWAGNIEPYENERNIDRKRSNECRGVRPYQLLEELQSEAQ